MTDIKFTENLQKTEKIISIFTTYLTVTSNEAAVCSLPLSTLTKIG